MEQPTFWQWAGFLVSIGLTLYAFWHLITGLLSRGRPGPDRHTARRRGVTRVLALRLWYGTVNVVGGFGWALIVAVGRAVRGLWRALVGERLATATAVPVKGFSEPLETYVALPAKIVRLNTSSAPSAVRPSASSAPDRPAAPAIPPALERLMVDRSRGALVEALVAAGWSKTRIREELSGANAAVGAEVDAAAARLEAARAPRETPLAQRPTAAQFPPKAPPAAAKPEPVEAA
jgi:hypothetical protein